MSLAAVLERAWTGSAPIVDASLCETAIGYIGYHLVGYLADGTVPTGEGTRFPMVAPYQVFPTGDGELMVAGGNDRLFRAICDVLGYAESSTTPASATNPDRVVQPRRTRTAYSRSGSAPRRRRPGTGG